MSEGIILARHGETDDNRIPLRVQGFRDTPLNAAGRRQAAEMAERLVNEEIRSLWSSDLLRAFQTAEIVGGRLGLEPTSDWRLREANRGRWEGRILNDIAREEPDGYQAWLRAPEEFRFPGGESLREQQVRVETSLREIGHRGPLPALVVCHGGCIRAILCLHHPDGLRAFHHFEVPNGALVRL